MGACVLEFKRCLDDHLSLIEFAYNNNFHASISVILFEALLETRCRTLVGWFELAEIAFMGPNLLLEAMEKVKSIRETD